MQAISPATLACPRPLAPCYLPRWRAFQAASSPAGPAPMTRMSSMICLKCTAASLKKPRKQPRRLLHPGLDPKRASNPNPIMITPESLLTQINPEAGNLVRNRPMPLLRSNHHSAEPRNTPLTNRIAER